MLIPEKLDTVGPDLERKMREQQRLYMLIGDAGRREISSVFRFRFKIPLPEHKPSPTYLFVS